MEKVYNNVTDSVKYLNYIKAYVDAYVNASGVISTPVISLDKAHPGISCLFLYEKTGLIKYKTAATSIRNLFVGASATYPKTATGNILWHKNNGSYNNIILIDGVYMMHPFLAKYGRMFSDNAAIDTAVNQTLYIYNQLYDNVQRPGRMQQPVIHPKSGQEEWDGSVWHWWIFLNMFRRHILKGHSY
jgi:unsaturated rhamnogalacturonyl hydrolase